VTSQRTLRARKGVDPERQNRRPYCGPGGTILQEACLTLSIDPILSSTDTYKQRHTQTGYAFHLAFYKGTGN